MHGDVVDTVTDLGGWIGNVLRMKSTIDWLPGKATVIGTESSRRRNGDEYPLRICRVQQYRVKAHSSRARLPCWPGAMRSQPSELLPGIATIS